MRPSQDEPARDQTKPIVATDDRSLKAPSLVHDERKAQQNNVPTAKAPPLIDDETKAADLLNSAQIVLDYGKKDKAKERLLKLLAEFPNTRAASKAKQLLDELNAKPE